MREHKDSYRNFDSVDVRFFNAVNVKLVIFIKLELSTSQKAGQITYKIDPEEMVA